MLNRHLKALSFQENIETWEDTKLRGSDTWEEEINKALDAASIAILLISTDFLASDFIRKNELPPLLQAAQNKGTRIFPVIVHPCLFVQNKNLSKFQSVNNPNRALSEVSKAEQERILVKLCIDIQSFLPESRYF